AQGLVTAYASDMPGGDQIYDLLFTNSSAYANGDNGAPSFTPAVLRFTPGITAGPSATSIAPPAAQSAFATLAHGPNGAIVVATEQSLFTFSNGAFSLIATLPVPGGVCGVLYSGDAFWVTQSLFFHDSLGTGRWSSRIDKVTTQGAVTSYAVPSSGRPACAPYLQGQDQIAIAPSGAIYYNENNADKIARLNPATGTTVEYAPGIGATMGVAVDARGVVWVAGSNGEIAEISGF
ncbi:MAG TPA: hypothetical protein VKT72_17555, partial [Candidatus Baltobacteraceae bacterium]|nr:hypothetical protein [Candidatus Baltobacteraceae bacterium]